MSETATKGRKTFLHGIHPPQLKHTSDLAIRRFPFAPVMMIPLSQHIGAPAKCVVREGQEVKRGQVIAEAGGFVSVPMHAPASGIIKRIAPSLNANGQMTPTIFLESFPGSGQMVSQSNDCVSMESTPDDIISAVQSAGLVGLGGAAFPTHVKLKIPEGKSVDTLIINGAECEPYLTTDHRVMLEQQEDIYNGIRLALKATGAKHAIIGIEDNKLDAVEALKKALPEGEPISVEAVPVKYPQGAEKMLIYSLLRREVPSGGLPSDVNVVVLNVGTVAEIGRLLPRGEGLVERVVTITGDVVENKGNYIIPTGTPLRYVLDQLNIKVSPQRILLGGPMMGPSVSNLDLPITKGTSGILILSEDQINDTSRKVHPCIKCGACLEACPMFLNPSRLGQLSRYREYETMINEYHLMDCFECGSCSYVCPSNIPLVQYFRIAKGVLKEQKAK